MHLSKKIGSRTVVIAVSMLVVACRRTPSTIGTATSFSLTEIAIGAGDSVEVGRPDFVRSGPNGLVYVASQYMSGLVMVLDSNARFVRTMGRRGPGPGEFQAVSMMYPKADSLVIGDRRGSVSLFGPDGSYFRTLPVTITSTSQVLCLRGDTLLVPEPVMTEARFGYPMQIVSPNGDTAKSIGTEDRSFDRRFVTQLYRKVAPIDDSTFWVARLDQYHLERWHMNGTLLQTIDQQRSWFPRLQADWDGTNAKPYPTMTRQLHEDHDGHLLVLIERANPDFKPTGVRPSQEGSGKAESLTSRLRYLEQVIEVLDASTGTLLGTIVSHGTYLLNFVDDGRLIGIRSNEDGSEFPVILRVSSHLIQP